MSMSTIRAYITKSRPGGLKLKKEKNKLFIFKSNRLKDYQDKGFFKVIKKLRNMMQTVETRMFTTYIKAFICDPSIRKWNGPLRTLNKPY